MSTVFPATPVNFSERSRQAIGDEAQRTGIRGAMDFLQSKRKAQFPDPQELSDLRERKDAISRLKFWRRVYWYGPEQPPYTEGPFCTACADSKQMVIRLKPWSTERGSWHCPVCKAVYSESD